MMRVKLGGLVVVLVVVLAAGCSPSVASRKEPDLSFEVDARVDPQQELHIRLGVHNEGPGTFEGDSSFNGEMEVRRMRSGELRASAHIIPLNALEPGESVWPLDWHGQLEAGSYELRWGAEGYGMTIESLTIVEEDGQLYFEGQPLATPSAAP